MVAFSATAVAQERVYEVLGPKDFRERLQTTDDAVLLDLRTPEELREGKLEGASQLDYFLKDFEDRVAELDKTKPYFIYCAGGGRSSETLELMKKLGFSAVYELKGGMTAWMKKGFQVAKDK